MGFRSGWAARFGCHRSRPWTPSCTGLLRNSHSVVAYALVAMIAAHVSAVLLHALTLRDGMLRRMSFGNDEPLELRRRT
ncbi:cytochrome b/b6 domain-containing protein [Mycolicibacterium nivoides]|uniref:Cytochrome b/b6 domain-containing protein n=1 Tax=Mycolicibacterium nivoides TaxID=2487344 RepID=A0ABW9L9L4_9MYCO